MRGLTNRDSGFLCTHLSTSHRLEEIPSEISAHFPNLGTSHCLLHRRSSSHLFSQTCNSKSLDSNLFASWDLQLSPHSLLSTCDKAPMRNLRSTPLLWPSPPAAMSQAHRQSPPHSKPTSIQSAQIRCAASASCHPHAGCVGLRPFHHPCPFRRDPQPHVRHCYPQIRPVRCTWILEAPGNPPAQSKYSAIGQLGPNWIFLIVGLHYTPVSDTGCHLKLARQMTGLAIPLCAKVHTGVPSALSTTVWSRPDSPQSGRQTWLGHRVTASRAQIGWEQAPWPARAPRCECSPLSRHSPAQYSYSA